MSKSDYVFISYSRTDNNFVEKLSADLRKQGISVWIDNQKIQAGANWMEEITKGLNNASALIYVISSDSVKSKWVERELQYIIQQNKIVLPVPIPSPLRAKKSLI